MRALSYKPLTSEESPDFCRVICYLIARAGR